MIVNGRMSRIKEKTIFLNSLNLIMSACSYFLFNILLILPFTILLILFLLEPSYLGAIEITGSVLTYAKVRSCGTLTKIGKIAGNFH